MIVQENTNGKKFLQTTVRINFELVSKLEALNIIPANSFSSVVKMALENLIEDIEASNLIGDIEDSTQSEATDSRSRPCSLPKEAAWWES